MLHLYKVSDSSILPLFETFSPRKKQGMVVTNGMSRGNWRHYGGSLLHFSCSEIPKNIPTELTLPYALGSSAAYLSAVPSLLLRFLLASQMILCINLCF